MRAGEGGVWPPKWGPMLLGMLEANMMPSYTAKRQAEKVEETGQITTEGEEVDAQ